MPAFLTNNTSQCCCPEMRCCTPETVTATLGGWGGTGMRRWVSRIYDYSPPLPAGWPDLDIGRHACAYEVGESGCFRYFDVVFDPALQRNVFHPEAIYDDCVGILWPAVAFPQMNAVSDQGWGCYPPDIVDFGPNSSGYVQGFVADETVADKCEQSGAGILCQKPPHGPDDIVYGPAGGSPLQFPGGRTYLPDYNNNSYVCHRLSGDMRPEFVATVNRSAPDTDEDVDARLVFDVFCRRNWQYSIGCDADVIVSLSCAVSDTPPANPPAGDWYCIDYRCGPRFPAADNINTYICTQYRCTAHEGMVWPHLLAFSDTENFTATLKLTLEVDARYSNTYYSYQAAKPQKGMSWRVAEVDILNAGTGYEVGETFTVDFDPFWYSQLTGGEIMFVFPDFDADCLNFPLQWRDKYGNGPQITNGVKRYYQSLRVMECDDDGGIVKLEIVPWFRDPDFVKGACPEVVPSGKRTPYYPGYSRVICHPNSVDIGGTNYNLYDTITFTPISPDVETYSEAIARVVDIDDDGAVLDWEIKGTDVWRYGFGLGNPYCYLMMPDERGAYRWADKKALCHLYWEGVGVPVRQALPYWPDPGVSVSFNYLETFQNTGNLTSIRLSVKRVPCRTTISVFDFAYTYDSISFETLAASPEADQKVRLLKTYLPYPKCYGGGAQIMPVIGTTGANESVIGGPLAGGVVKSGGDYYAFVDKRHVEPILPKQVPSIGNGAGAVIDNFVFSQVLGFPREDYASDQLHVPAQDRFAYYPVTSATILSRGSGYEVGAEFEVKPNDGEEYQHAWKKSGGDDPDENPNGAWYKGQNLNSSGRVPLETVVNGVRTVEEEFEFAQPFCRLRVSAVDANGGITGLEVLDGGLMYRTVWASGVSHPDVSVYVGSDTGYGARATIQIDTDKDSETFGEVVSCAIVAIPIAEGGDPVHSTAENPVAMPLGGRDYANPKSGMMWEMENIRAGEEFGIEPATMLSYVNWHGWYYDAYHPENSSHELLEGTHPPFARRGDHCTLDECYHSLLNRTYSLCRVWSGLSVNGPYGPGAPGGTITTQARVEMIGCGLGPNSYSPLPLPRGNSNLLDGRPKGPYGLYKSKNKIVEVYLPGPSEPCDENNYFLFQQRVDQQPGYTGPPTADVGDYIVIEHGYTVSLSAAIPVYPNCPDHNDGRTSP
jgi:hypothetical protein